MPAFHTRPDCSCPPHPPPPPPLLQNISSLYKPGPVIGKGAYGFVIDCVKKNNGEHLACKSVDVDELLKTRDGPNIIARLRNEIGTMSYLAGHPNIVALKDVCESDSHIFLVQELCTGGTLKDAFGPCRARVGEARVAGIFRGIVKAVLHCHQVGACARVHTTIYCMHA